MPATAAKQQQTRPAGNGSASSTKASGPVAVFAPVAAIPNGDGTFKVSAGKPIFRLDAVRLGRHFGVDRDSVLAWRADGTIPDRFVTRAGKLKLLFDASVVPYLEEKFREMHE